VLDAIEKLGRGLLPREHSPCSATKRIDNRLVSRLIQKNNNQDIRVRTTDHLSKIESSLGLVVEFGANDYDLCVVGLQNAK
jgi:hypothetical protein